MRVLVVEPSKFSRIVITLALEQRGLFVDSICTAKEATCRVDNNDYEVICIARAVGMEEFRSFCTYMRSRSQTHMTPIVLLTSGDEFEIQPYMALGVTEIVDKTEAKSLGEHIVKTYVKTVAGNNPDSGKILYIEDSPSIALVISNQLTMANHQITHFLCGEAALENYEPGSYDLVITDVVLGGQMNGVDIVRHIREREDNEAIPVAILAMSGFSDTSRTLSLLEAGANDYVTKPIIAEELQARVNNLILNQHLLKRLQVQQVRLEQLAMTDQLTGLYNRHYLEHVAQKKIAVARRHKVEMCLIVIDVDHFKQVNDQHGHSVGDLGLTQISALLAENVRNEDIAARYGGEEFVIVLDHCPLAAALAKAEQLRKWIAELQPENLTVTASFGVTHYKQEDEQEFSSLFTRADQAVYQAKNSGRNCVVAVG